MTSSAIPAAWLEAVERVGDRVLGPLRAPLAELVEAQSRAYTRERGGEVLANVLDEATALQARWRFFFARDLEKVFFPLAELAPHLPSGAWRVLDLGAGLGTTSLGAALFRRQVLGDEAELEVVALDQTARALEVYAAFVAEVDPGVRLRTKAVDLRSAPLPAGPFDLVLMGLMLNELDDDAAERLLARVQSVLAPGGAVVILEPALRDVTRRLHRLRERFRDAGWTLYSPCLHERRCPMLASERDWCHQEREFRLPDALVPVARAAGLRFERQTFTSLVLRRDGVRVGDGLPEAALRVVSQPLVSKGKRELFACPRASGDEVSRVLLRRLDRQASAANADFAELRRGELLEVSQPDVRKNAWRVGPETRVRRLAPRAPEGAKPAEGDAAPGTLDDAGRES